MNVDVMRRLAEATEIMEKYDKHPVTNGRIGGMYLGVDPAEVSADDLKRMAELGWEADEELGCMSARVSGKGYLDLE